MTIRIMTIEDYEGVFHLLKSLSRMLIKELMVLRR